MNFTKFKLKGLLSIAMLVGILTTSWESKVWLFQRIQLNYQINK